MLPSEDLVNVALPARTSTARHPGAGRCSDGLQTLDGPPAGQVSSRRTPGFRSRTLWPARHISFDTTEVSVHTPPGFWGCVRHGPIWRGGFLYKGGFFRRASLEQLDEGQKWKPSQLLAIPRDCYGFACSVKSVSTANPQSQS